MSKGRRFTVPFSKQLEKRAQTLFKSKRGHHYHIYWSLWRILSLKKSLLLICKILRLFVKTFTARHKCSLLNRDNFTQPIQMLFSGKQKTFSEFFSDVLKSRLYSNMVNWSKHCSNLNDGTITIFIDHCEGSWAWKSLS